MHVQRISAIFEKDVKDFMKNMMLLMMPVIPIVLSLLYSQIDLVEELPVETAYIVVGVTFSGVTSCCMMTMMAEENEKKTLRGLILSPASFVDIIVGKSLVVALMTLLSLVISLLLIDITPLLNLRALIGLLVLFLFFLLLGVGIGLFAKSVSATSAYLMPILFLFGMTPIIEMLGLGEDSLAMNIVDRFPLMQAISMHDTGSWLPLGIILIWVAAAALFAFLCFKKTMTDD